MAKSWKPMNRRELFRRTATAGIGGAVALEQLAGVPLVGTWMSEHILNPYGPTADAYLMMQQALRGGPAMFAVHKAMAQANDEWSVVQIKVCNHVHTPLVFALGQLSNGAVSRTGNPVSMRGGNASATLQTLGSDEISDNPRYANLRLNRWFANILHNGTSDGQAPAGDGSNLIGLSSQDVEPLNDERVALQTFLGLRQIETNNHALKGCKLRSDLPDLTLFAHERELIDSPLGISCFMMGNEYDRAEGSVSQNAVLGPQDSETAIIASRTVGDYVDQIGQYVGRSYADRSPIEQNVIFRLDRMVVEEPVLRKELVNSISEFQAGLGTLQDAADLETTFQTLDATTGNTQSLRTSGASGEFVAQCKYVAEALELSGQPLRNFSLFLNIVDLDGNDLDNNTVNGINLQIAAFSYVEGMRQLAMGLNILGKKIAAGKKIMVVVHSEGGRGADMTDSVTSFAMVMGPKGAGMLDDALHANMEQINQNAGAVNDMAAGSAAVAWDTDTLKDKDGGSLDQVPDTGDVQMGVIEFLEEKTGKDVRGDLSANNGRFVQLKRK